MGGLASCAGDVPLTTLVLGVLAHVKWFTDPRLHPTQYGLLLSLPVIGAFLLAIGATGVAYLIQHRVPEPKVRMVETACGLFLLAGLFTRYAAIVLALLGIVAMVPFSIESILEQVHILGIAVFLFIAGPGRVSLDARRRAERALDYRDAPAVAISLLRIAMGFGIAYGALTEKLLNPALAQALLDQSPFLNVLRPLGVSDPVFIWLAGATELVIGVVILSGQITRPVMAVGFALFTVTLIVFGLPEFIGHLPFYGIMLTLFIAPDADSWHVQRALRPAA